MLTFKDGVKLFGIRGEVVLSIMTVSTISQRLAIDTVVTSVTDGVHSRTSLHYSGSAVDFRISHIEPGRAKNLVERIRAALTDEFDVVLESDHVHVEFQPKRV